MFDSDEEQRIAQTFVATHLPRAEHKALLEAQLLSQFDKTQTQSGRPKVQKQNMKRVFFGLAIAAALGIAACAAPVDVDVAVGRSMTIAYTAGGTAPAPPEVMQTLEKLGHFDNVNVRVRRMNDEITIQVDLWGEEAGEKAFGEALKKAMPALASAKIEEQPLSGTMQSTLGKKLGHDLFDIDLAGEKDVAVIREKILADLAAQGVEGQVNVEVQDEGGGQRKVKVQVIKEGECEPGSEMEKKIGP